ncbi:MAG: type II toxin-antitoxin system HicB family antitoxin [Hyphomicrobiaceae bacterium]|nr:type II toxin-antitoxin system HicB family antitoxin [Hyphomicrobiaceae bacterium]
MVSKHSYTIVLEPDEDGGFVVTVPALPEVGTQGDSREEAIAHAHEAVFLALEERSARGEPFPLDVEPQLERITVAA